MPNWCLNNMVITGDQKLVAELADKIIVPNPHGSEPATYFDFNGILPMPDALHIDEGSMLAYGLLPPDAVLAEQKSELSSWQYNLLAKHLSPLADWPTLTVAEANRLFEADTGLQGKCRINLELGRQLLNNILLYGHPTWYLWSINNWGTKWNSYGPQIDVSDGRIQVVFDTAWSPPEGVYRAICEAYPGLRLEAQYYEPGIWFAGTFTGVDGKFTDTPCSDEEVKQFAIDCFDEYFEEEDESEDDEV